MAKNLDELYVKLQQENPDFDFKSVDEFTNFINTDENANMVMSNVYGVDDIESYAQKKKEDFSASDSLLAGNNQYETALQTFGAKDAKFEASEMEVNLGDQGGAASQGIDLTSVELPPLGYGKGLAAAEDVNPKKTEFYVKEINRLSELMKTNPDAAVGQARNFFKGATDWDQYVTDPSVKSALAPFNEQYQKSAKQYSYLQGAFDEVAGIQRAIELKPKKEAGIQLPKAVAVAVETGAPIEEPKSEKQRLFEDYQNAYNELEQANRFLSIKTPEQEAQIRAKKDVLDGIQTKVDQYIYVDSDNVFKNANFNPDGLGEGLLTQSEEGIKIVNPEYVRKVSENWVATQFDIPEDMRPLAQRRMENFLNEKANAKMLEPAQIEIFNKMVDEKVADGTLIGDDQELKRRFVEISNETRELESLRDSTIKSYATQRVEEATLAITQMAENLNTEIDNFYNQILEKSVQGLYQSQGELDMDNEVLNKMVSDASSQIVLFQSQVVQQTEAEIKAKQNELNEQYKKKLDELGISDKIKELGEAGEILAELGVSAYKQASVNHDLSRKLLQELQYSSNYGSWALDRAQGASARALSNIGSMLEYSFGIGNPVSEVLRFTEFTKDRNLSMVGSLADAENYKDVMMGVTGQLLDQLPNLSLGIAAGAITANPYISGLVMWGVDTADQVGQNFSDVLDKTGNAFDAKQAASSTLALQTAMMPLYAVQAIPFASGIVGKAGSNLTRAAVAAGRIGGFEYIPELITELGQNYKAAQLAGYDKGFATYMNEELPSLAIDVLPTVLALSGAGEVSSYAREMDTKLMVESIKSALGEAGLNQFMMDAYSVVGASGMRAMPQYMLASGMINEKMAVAMSKNIDAIVETMPAVQQRVKDDNQAKLYIDLMTDKQNMQEQIDGAKSEASKNILNLMMSEIDAKMKAILNGEKLDYTTITTKDGRSFVFSNEKAMAVVSKNKSIAEGIQTGSVTVESSNPDIKQAVERVRTDKNAVTRGKQKIVSVDTGTNVNAAIATDTTAVNTVVESAKDKTRAQKIADEAKSKQAYLNAKYPGVNIVLHTTDSFMDKMGKVDGRRESSGNIAIKRNEDGTYGVEIQIDVDRASDTTIDHEITHLELLSNFGNNQAKFKEMMTTLEGIMNEKEKAELYKFIQPYSINEQPEEFLAQFSAVIANNGDRLSQSTMQKIALAINAVMRKLTGGRIIPFKDINSRNEVITFFNTIADSLAAAKGNISNVSVDDVQVDVQEEVLADGANAVTEDLDGQLYEPTSFPALGETNAQDIVSRSSLDVNPSSIDRGSVRVEPITAIDPNITRGKKYNVTMSDHTKVGDYSDANTGVKRKGLSGGFVYSYISQNIKARAAWSAVTVKATRDLILNSNGQDMTLVYRMARNSGAMGNIDFASIAFDELTAPVRNGKVSEAEFMNMLNDKLVSVSAGKALLRATYGPSKQRFGTGPEVEIEIKRTLKEQQFESLAIQYEREGKVLTEEEFNEIPKKEKQKIKIEDSIPTSEKIKVNLFANIKEFENILLGDNKVSFAKRGPMWKTVLKEDASKKDTSDWYRSLRSWGVATINDINNQIAEPLTDNASDGDIVGAIKIDAPEFVNVKGKEVPKIYTPYTNLVDEANGVFYIDAVQHPSYPYVATGEPIGVFTRFAPIQNYFPVINEWMSKDKEGLTRADKLGLVSDKVDFLQRKSAELQDALNDPNADKASIKEEIRKTLKQVNELKKFTPRLSSPHKAVETMAKELNENFNSLGDIEETQRVPSEELPIVDLETYQKTRGFNSKSQIEPWSEPQQEITSAETSINKSKLPGVYTDAKLFAIMDGINKPEIKIVDVGSGKFAQENIQPLLESAELSEVLNETARQSYAQKAIPKIKQILENKKVSYFPYDPFNQPADVNQNTVANVSGGRADIAVSPNVLNVIAEPGARLGVIANMADAVGQTGTAIIQIYEGSGKGNAAVTKTKGEESWQNNQKAEWYVPEVKEFFSNVQRKGSYIIADNKPSLFTSKSQRFKFEEGAKRLSYNGKAPNFRVLDNGEIIENPRTNDIYWYFGEALKFVKENNAKEYKSKSQIDNLIADSKKIGVPQRYKGDVGKLIGGELYAHKSASTVFPSNELQNAIDKLPDDFNYEVIKYNAKEKSFSFIASPDWNTSDEPIVGDAYKVKANGDVSITRQKKDPQIYHHKWNFVRDGYAGFDVEKSIQRSIDWYNSAKPYVNMYKIGTQSYWNQNAEPLIPKRDTGFVSKSAIDRQTIVDNAYTEYNALVGQGLTDLEAANALYDSYDYSILRDAIGSAFVVKDPVTGKSMYDNIVSQRAVEVAKKLDKAKAETNQKIEDFISQNPDMSISELRSELLNQGFGEYVVFQNMNNIFGITTSTELTEEQKEIRDAFGPEYRQTVKNALDTESNKNGNPIFDTSEFEELSQDERSLKVEQNRQELNDIIAASGISFIDASVFVNSMVDKMREGGLVEAAEALRGIIDSYKKGIVDNVDIASIMQSFAAVQSLSGRILNMARGLFEKDMASMMLKSLEMSNVVVTPAVKAKVDLMVSNFNTTKDAYKQAEKEFFESALDDAAYDNYMRALKDHARATKDITDFMDARKPRFWNETITSMGSRGLLGIPTMVLSIVSNAEQYMYSTNVASKGMQSLFDRGLRGDIRSSFFSPYKNLLSMGVSARPTVEQMTDMIKNGSSSDVNNINKYYDQMGNVNFMKDQQRLFDFVNNLFTKKYGKKLSEMTDEEFAENFDQLLVENKQGKIKLADGKAYTVAQTVWNSFFGALPELTGRLMVLGGDRMFGNGAAYRSMIDYIWSSQIGDRKGGIIENYVKDRNGKLDYDTAKNLSRLINIIMESDNPFEKEGLKRVFLADNWLSSAIGNQRGKFRRKIVNSYFAIAQGKADSIAIELAKKFGYQTLDVLFWTMAPFIRVPYNVVMTALQKTNPAGATAAFLSSKRAYDIALDKFNAKYPNLVNNFQTKEAAIEYEKDKADLFVKKRQAAYDAATIPTSTAITTFAVLAYMAGAVIPVGKPGDDKEKALQLSGLKGGTFNFTLFNEYIAAMLRGENVDNFIAKRGGFKKDGDIIVDFRNMGLLGFALGGYSSAFSTYRSTVAEGENTMSALVKTGVDATIGMTFLSSATAQLPMLQGIDRIVKLGQSGVNDPNAWSQWIGGTAATVGAFTSPSILSFVSKGDAELIQGTSDLFPEIEDAELTGFLGKGYVRAINRLNRNWRAFDVETEYYKPMVGPFGEDLQYRTTVSTPGTTEAYVEAMFNPFSIRKAGDLVPLTPDQLAREKGIYATAMNVNTTMINMGLAYEQITGAPTVVKKDKPSNTSIFPILLKPLKNEFTVTANGATFTYSLPNDMYRAELKKRGNIRFQSVKTIESQIESAWGQVKNSANNEEFCKQKIEQAFDLYNNTLNAADGTYRTQYEDRQRATLKELQRRGVLSDRDIESLRTIYGNF